MNNMKDIDVLYSPSHWSNRYTNPEEVIQKHIEFIDRESETAKRTIPCQLEVPYGSADREKMDIFGTNLPSDSPIFIYIHGGYWEALSREQSSYVVKPLINNGFRVIILGYTLCPQVTIMEIMKQIERAFLKCLEYAKTNSSRGIYICGHSAGAQLASSLFQSFFTTLPEKDQKLLKAVFLISGVYDLTPLVETYYNNSFQLNMKTAEDISPLYQHFSINDETKVFIIIGEYDSPPFREQSEKMQNKLEALGIASQLIFLPNTDHFLIVERLNDDNYELVKLIADTRI